MEFADSIFALPGPANLNFDRSGVNIESNGAVNGIILMESPVYGKRLFGVVGGWWFYQLRFDGPLAGDVATPIDHTQEHAIPYNAARLSLIHI